MKDSDVINPRQAWLMVVIYARGMGETAKSIAFKGLESATPFFREGSNGLTRL